MNPFLSYFQFPDSDEEFDFRLSVKRTCYDNFYPFGILAKDRPLIFNFEPVTMLYGGNGSGKSTALNVIAEKLSLTRDTLYNRSGFFPDYVKLCDAVCERDITPQSRIITSDDVFDFMLNLRSINDGVSLRREELTEDYLGTKGSSQRNPFQMRSLADYDELKKVNAIRHKTQSRYISEHLASSVRTHSNGESAHLYFTEKIQEHGLYLLDEPENSLSPDRQLELLKFLEDSVRFFDCQFVIATHSPFLLSMKDAKIYDLDAKPVSVKKWTELKNVRTYYEFFKNVTM